jgi:hypothetical protein
MICSKSTPRRCVRQESRVLPVRIASLYTIATWTQDAGRPHLESRDAVRPPVDEDVSWRRFPSPLTSPSRLDADVVAERDVARSEDHWLDRGTVLSSITRWGGDSITLSIETASMPIECNAKILLSSRAFGSWVTVSLLAIGESE